MSDIPGLKGCPYCAGKDLECTGNAHEQYVTCLTCFAQGPVVRQDEPRRSLTPDTAAAWNRRDPAAIVVDPESEEQLKMLARIIAPDGYDERNFWKRAIREMEIESGLRKARAVLTALRDMGRMG